ncbi:hypothetical protein WDU94_000848 [Cyamophila willieti]
MANDLAEILNAVNILKDEKAEVVKSSNALNEELNRFNIEFSELTEINGELRQHLEESNEKISQLKQKSCSLEGELHRKENEEKAMVKLYAEYDELKENIVKLKDKRQTNTEQIEKLEKEYEDLQPCPQEKDHNIVELENIIEKLQHKLSDHKDVILNLKADKSSLRKSMEECKDHLQEKSLEESAFSLKMENFEKEKQKLAGQLKDLQKCRKEMNEACKVQNIKKEKLNEEIKYFQERNSALRKENESLEYSVMGLKRKCNSGYKDLDKKYKALDKLCEDYDGDKKRIIRIRQQLSSSYSTVAKPVDLSSLSTLRSTSRRYRTRTVGGCGDRRSFNSKPLVTRRSLGTRNIGDIYEPIEPSQMSTRTSRTFRNYKSDKLSTNKIRSKSVVGGSSSQTIVAHSSRSSRPIVMARSRSSRPIVMTHNSRSSRPSIDVAHRSRSSRPIVMAHSSRRSKFNFVDSPRPVIVGSSRSKARDSCDSCKATTSVKPERNYRATKTSMGDHVERLQALFPLLNKEVQNQYEKQPSHLQNYPQAVWSPRLELLLELEEVQDISE